MAQVVGDRKRCATVYSQDRSPERRIEYSNAPRGDQ